MARAKTHAKFSNRKISETFLDFAEPLLAPLGAEATEHEMEEALKIAFTVWNAVVFDAVNRNSRWVDQLRDLAGHDPDVRPIIEQLVAQTDLVWQRPPSGRRVPTLSPTRRTASPR